MSETIAPSFITRATKSISRIRRLGIIKQLREGSSFLEIYKGCSSQCKILTIQCRLQKTRFTIHAMYSTILDRIASIAAILQEKC